jgi:hypothetical protein
MEACYGGTVVMERSCAMARGAHTKAKAQTYKYGNHVHICA